METNEFVPLLTIIAVAPYVMEAAFSWVRRFVKSHLGICLSFRLGKWRC